MTPDLPPDLSRKRRAAHAALWFEQVWLVAWLPLGVAGAYAVFALLDGPAWLPGWLRVALPLMLLAVAAGLVWHGVRVMRRPDAAAADARLELDSGLRHRPLSVLDDRPVQGSAEAEALWGAHRARVLGQLRGLRVRWPRPGLPARDGRALRALVGVGLVAAIVIAGDEAPRRIWAAVAPGLPQGAAAPGTVVQAWATPPAYTGLPPVFLKPGTPAAPIPAGSHLTVNVTGGHGEPGLALDDESTEFKPLDATSWQAEREVGHAGVLVVRRRGELARWTLAVIPDHPPTIRFTEAPGPAIAGGRPTLQTRLPWEAADDYGVVSVQAEIRLQARPDAPPLIVPVPLGGSPKQAHGALVQDLTPHPWAGLPVTVRMVAKDAPGQAGASADAALTLPERAFTNPTAQAIIAIRRQLSLTPDGRAAARYALAAVAERPEVYGGTASLFLNIQSIGFLLVRGRDADTVDQAQARMWQLALSLEEGAADRAAQALAEARQAARDAMEEARQDPGNAEKQAELDKRMQELREAIQKRMDALAEQARREGTQLPPLDPKQPQLTERDLDRMAQRMQEAAREGRTDDARQQMAELEKLLDALQNARPETGEEREQRNAERRDQGRQQQSAVQDLVKREGDLLDRSRTRSDTAQQPPGQPKPGQSTAQREQDAKRQAAMRRALGELMQRFGDLTGAVPEPLGQADMAMREAGQATAEGRDAAAGAAQQKAIEALQKGGRAMGQQMARQFGRGTQPGEGEDGQEGEGEGDGSGTGPGDDATANRDGSTTGPKPGDAGPPRRRTARRDPLGRPMQQGTSGTDETGDVRVPDQMEQARGRALQEELRRRGAERTRPRGELDYIDRLLAP